MALTREHQFPLVFYGDDFTGSVDVMESLTINGVPTVLFLSPPTTDDLSAFPHVRAVGVAGIARTMSPTSMDAELPALFRRLKALGAPLFHYKICSTFDSSPSVGSIGKAGEILRSIFGLAPIPIVVGVPELRRYTAFGHLFATADGITYRLDRHPTMSVHPMTPMDDSDLRVHLRRQSHFDVELVDLNTVLAASERLDQEVDRVAHGKSELYLLDNVNGQTTHAIGRQLDRLGRLHWTEAGSSMAVIGSSGVEYALTSYWELPKTTGGAVPEVAPASPTLVIAGSRAPATSAQTRYAVDMGFADIEIDPYALLDSSVGAATREQVVKRTLKAIADGEHAVVHMSDAIHVPGGNGTYLASELARIAYALTEEVTLCRLVVAGGDTSGLVARALGIKSLEIARPLAPGAPLCTATSNRRGIDRAQVCLKGGQIGGADYFVRIAEM